jgi:hypothetical protein
LQLSTIAFRLLQSSFLSAYSASLKASALIAEILYAVDSTSASYSNPPPAYADAIIDPPPEYDGLDDLARTYIELDRSAPSRAEGTASRTRTPACKDLIAADPSIDFSDTSRFQSHAGRKKKATAARKAAQEAWGGSSDNEGDNNAAGDGQNKENAGGGGDAGGNGNNGDDGGGGDDGDDWNTNPGKKKKNKKGKSKKDDEEEKKRKEEEERKRMEEEEEAERLKEDGLAASAANAGNSLSWADEMNEDNPDEWHGFTTASKKKKSRKNKASYNGWQWTIDQARLTLHGRRRNLPHLWM